MSSTPGRLELQYLDHIPLHLRPKPLYGNIVDVSRTTGKCTIVTWPTSARQRQRQKVRTYTFILSELPKTQASAMLQRALMTWIEQVVDGGVGAPDMGKSKAKRSLNVSDARPSDSREQEPRRSMTEMSTKERDKLLIGPRVTFFDEEDMLVPPPLPPKDGIYSDKASSSHLPPASDSVKRRHHHHRQGRRSTEQTHVATAVDIGLVWWESDLHGQRV